MTKPICIMIKSQWKFSAILMENSSGCMMDMTCQPDRTICPTCALYCRTDVKAYLTWLVLICQPL